MNGKEEAKKAYDKEYYQKNKGKINKRCRDYNKKNKGKIKRYFKKWYQDNNGREYMVNYRALHPVRHWATNSINSHKKSGYTINFSLDDLEHLGKCTTSCIYCECELHYILGKGQRTDGPTLDRIDNNIVLDIRDTQIICKKCNFSKQNRAHKEFILYCKKVGGLCESY